MVFISKEIIEDRQLRVLVCSGMIFLLSFWMGISLAKHKPLWIDEIHAQVNTVASHSYFELFFPKFKVEGNNAPLFYCIQKFVSEIFSFRLPDHVVDPYSDLTAQVVLRIQPVFWMSLSIAVIFFYFAKTFGILSGLISWMMALSTFMVWAYWAEARLYAPWVFLTTLQSLIVLSVCRGSIRSDVSWKVLVVLHILLVFTTTSSIFQILGVSVLLYILGHRKTWTHFFIMALPMIICLFYVSRAMALPFKFWDPALKMITANLPIERIVVITLCAFFLLWRERQAGRGWHETFYFLYYGLMLAAAFSILLIFKIKSVPPDQVAFPVHARHFIFLAPIGIIVLTLALSRLLEIVRSRTSKALLWLLVGLLVLPRLWVYSHRFPMW